MEDIFCDAEDPNMIGIFLWLGALCCLVVVLLRNKFRECLLPLGSESFVFPSPV
jgi:hypothetical protein